MTRALRTCFFILSIAVPISTSVFLIACGIGSFAPVSLRIYVLQLLTVIILWTLTGLLLLRARSKK